MEQEYPKVVSDTADELTYEACTMCDNDAMMGHNGKGYCGVHYSEVMGWDVPMDEQGED